MARIRNRRKPVAEMNVVPYIDVMLVLLVIFMVTAPMLNQGVKVDLPKVSSEVLPQDNDALVLTISIKADKTYYWNLGSEVDTDKQMDKAMTLPDMTSAVTKIIAAGRDPLGLELPQLDAADLARHRLRELVDELDDPDVLVRVEVFVAMFEHRRCCFAAGLIRGCQTDVGLRDSAAQPVR